MLYRSATHVSLLGIIVLALVAWAAFRFQLWRMRRSARGARDIYRV